VIGGNRRTGSRGGRAAVVAVAVAVAVAGAGPGPAAGAQQPPVPTPVPVPVGERLVDVEGLDPVLDGVPVEDTSDLRRAGERFDGAQQARAEATLRWIEADQHRLQLAAQAAQAGTAVTEGEQQVARADEQVVVQQSELARRDAVTARRRHELSVQQALLRRMAVAVFTSAPTDSVIGLGTFADMSASTRREAVRDTMTGDQSATVDARTATWRRALGASRAQGRRVERARNDRRARQAELAAAIALRDDAVRILTEADRAAADRRTDLDRAEERGVEALVERREARLLSHVTDLDLTLVALHAYWRASSLAPCKLPWWVVAGVGRVETRHGTAQGSVVGVDGTTSVPILGIPLDGRPGTMAIPDSDGGLLDRDGAWDRAVGPMQFIPGTWRRWAADANNDTVADPHNLYDAADAAAKYLCYTRGDLLTDDAIRGALRAYNNSAPYGSKVLAEAHRYQEAVDLPDLAPPPLPEPPDAAEGG
jgi:hypothetical protein